MVNWRRPLSRIGEGRAIEGIGALYVAFAFVWAVVQVDRGASVISLLVLGLLIGVPGVTLAYGGRWLSRADIDELGTHGRMNPPLRSEKRRSGVYERVVDGTVDMIATDHAPHTRDEKDAAIWDAPSGVPGVETMLPLLLAEARDGALTYERVRDLVAANPADVFDLPDKGRIAEGTDADLVLVDTDDVREISGEGLHSNCEWTPFQGFEGVFPQWTMVRGSVVYDSAEDTFWDQQGKNVR